MSDSLNEKSSVKMIESVKVVPVLSEAETHGKVVNPLLIFTCIAFGASTLLFGFDNNVISPIVALQPFVSVPLVVTTTLTCVFRSRNTKASIQSLVNTSLRHVIRTCCSLFHWSVPSLVPFLRRLSLRDSVASGLWSFFMPYHSEESFFNSLLQTSLHSSSDASGIPS